MKIEMVEAGFDGDFEMDGFGDLVDLESEMMVKDELPMCDMDFMFPCSETEVAGELYPEYGNDLQKESASENLDSSSQVSLDEFACVKEEPSSPRRCPTSDITKEFSVSSPTSSRVTIVRVPTREEANRARAEAIKRFRLKRAARCFKKKIRYECRKKIAASRPRVGGRFAKKSDLERVVSLTSLCTLTSVVE
uniref:CCT domain-containing protein n=1 Tax=Compsopogon caeruleus TaxID=31354 RepID=A0A7S1T940_9RHOD|mmetsp:Transcript_13058/g.26491  ORF Transcript_13058/g.26491 Transcript_13058/m.26491 type:complete len:193 (+) Transcript_13058:212-790(+)